MQTLAYNRKARYDYEILEKFQAGLALSGLEVKAIKNNRADLTDSYALIRGNEAYLLNCKIYPLQPKNALDYQPERTRKLLLTKKEIKYLTGKAKERRLTLVPLKLYNKGGLLKLELGLAKGKRKFEKREKIRQRQTKREIERSLKQNPKF